MHGNLPHQAAISHSGGASTMHLARTIQIPAHSFEFAGSDPVLAEKTQLRPQHNQHCPDAVSLHTNELQEYAHRTGDQISILHNELYGYDNLQPLHEPLFPVFISFPVTSDTIGSAEPSFLAFLLIVEQRVGKSLFASPPLWGWQTLQEVRFLVGKNESEDGVYLRCYASV